MKKEKVMCDGCFTKCEKSYIRYGNGKKFCFECSVELYF